MELSRWRRMLCICAAWLGLLALSSSKTYKERVVELEAEKAELLRMYEELQARRGGLQVPGTRWREALVVNREAALRRVAWNMPPFRGPSSAVLLSHASGGRGSLNSTLLECTEVDVVLVHALKDRNCLLVAETPNDVNSDRLHRYFRTEGQMHDFYPGAYNAHAFRKDTYRYGIHKHKEAQESLSELITFLPTLEKDLEKALAAMAKNKEPIIVMTVNEGQVDLLFNFFCSTRRYGIDASRHLVFASSEALAKDLRKLGIKAYYHTSFGDFPGQAAKAYGDRTFHKMMKLKILAPYFVSRMGYPVLFQDVDLVWFKDPLEYFEKEADPLVDVFFMDDGARSLRFSPYAANSGFFFSRAGMRSTLFYWESLLQGEYFLRGFTTSHQEVITRALLETEGRFGMISETLPIREFVSGQQYHRNKTYMEEIRETKRLPWVMHYCWTLSRIAKAQYMRIMGHWFLAKKYDRFLDKLVTTSTSEASGSKRSAIRMMTFAFSDLPCYTQALKFVADHPGTKLQNIPAEYVDSNLDWKAIRSDDLKSWKDVCA